MNDLVDRAETALRQGRYGEARDALERALAGALDARLASEARSMLGLALVGMGDAGAALPHLRAAVAAEPGEAMFRYNLGRGLFTAGDQSGAIAQYSEAVRLAPGMAPLEIALAQAMVAAGQASQARPLLEKHGVSPHAAAPIVRILVQARTADGDLHGALDASRRLVPVDLARADPQQRADAMTTASLAHAAMHYGEAKEILHGLVCRDPADADAATVLSQLLLWTDGADAARAELLAAREAGAASPRILINLLSLDGPVEEEAKRLAASDNTSPSDRADLLLALAQRADRAGDVDSAWQLSSEGKALLPHSPQRDWRGTLDRQMAMYRVTAPVTLPDAVPHHLYLLGTPRSGQSLVQSILAAAPGVSSLGERGALLQHLLFRDEEIGAMSPAQRADLFGELAMADRRGIERLVGATDWAVDKSPLNLAIAGNIARIHPAARFAAVLRDPADVAVSIWLRRFPPVYDYANDFAGILDQLDFALDAMAAWIDAGLRLRLIDFPRLVSDPVGEGARLFEWIGLPWRPDYLVPANRTAPVPTYSANQVRKNIGEGGSAGAAPYAAYLTRWQVRLDALRAKQARLFQTT